MYDPNVVEECLKAAEPCPDGFYHEYIGPQEEGALKSLTGKSVCRKMSSTFARIAPRMEFMSPFVNASDTVRENNVKISALVIIMPTKLIIDVLNVQMNVEDVMDQRRATVLLAEIIESTAMTISQAF